MDEREQPPAHDPGRDPGAHSGAERRAQRRTVTGTASAAEGYRPGEGTAAGEPLDGAGGSAEPGRDGEARERREDGGDRGEDGGGRAAGGS